MEKIEKKEKRFGLVGKEISYSFSRGYFAKKFTSLQLSNYSYENFDLADISEFAAILNKNTISGLNVTIPYKESVIPFLNDLDKAAEEIGAVNTIKFTSKGLKGYNTDAFGFQNSLTNHLTNHHKKALILGTGGASKAIAYVFKNLEFPFQFVSRTPKEGQLSYKNLNRKIVQEHQIIVNSSPVGTHPNILEKPDIPYQYLTQKHFLFDLIYNPEKTAFLQEGEKRGAVITNGLRMLELQAEKAWEIWNS